jgi:hypothetical protein
MRVLDSGYGRGELALQNGFKKDGSERRQTLWQRTFVSSN